MNISIVYFKIITFFFLLKIGQCIHEKCTHKTTGESGKCETIRNCSNRNKAVISKCKNFDRSVGAATYCCTIADKFSTSKAEQKCMEYRRKRRQFRSKRRLKRSPNDNNFEDYFNWEDLLNDHDMENLNDDDYYHEDTDINKESYFFDNILKWAESLIDDGLGMEHSQSYLPSFNNTTLNNTHQMTMDGNGLGFVFGGENAKDGQYPHMVALAYEDSSIVWHCGGTLISEKFILTAAHCTDLGNGLKVKYARLGDINLNGATGKIINVLSINYPKEFTFSKRYHDIALLELEETVAFSYRILPACLFINKGDRNAFKNEKVYATGWGYINTNDERSDILQTVNLQYFPNCAGELNSSLLPSGVNETIQICYGHMTEQKDTCAGDSGGPLFYSDKNIDVVIGLTSIGHGCGKRNRAAAYTRVSFYIDWIESVVWK